MTLTIKTGDLLEATEQLIIHQVNCVSNGGAAGIARAIFDKYPYADCYNGRTQQSVPGTIDIRGNGRDQRLVCNLNGQFYPGGVQYPHSNKDGYVARERYFQQCLDRITEIEGLKSIAFPWMVGCGIAGGSWPNYLAMITSLSIKLEDRGADVVIYRRE